MPERFLIDREEAAKVANAEIARMGSITMRTEYANGRLDAAREIWNGLRALPPYTTAPTDDSLGQWAKRYDEHVEGCRVGNITPMSFMDFVQTYGMVFNRTTAPEPPDPCGEEERSEIE